jgi:hypothetical protein
MVVVELKQMKMLGFHESLKMMKLLHPSMSY